MRTKHRSQWSWICILLLLAITVTGCSSSEGWEKTAQSDDPPIKIEILFIGNSFTFFNDTPEILANLAKEGGHDLQVETFAEGGWTLEKHAASIKTSNIIRQRPWDYVVLQEQSVIPSNVVEREQSMYPAIRKLNTEIENVGSDTILFLTWAKREGMPQSGFNSYGEMQREITNGYLEIANEVNVIVAPVGEAWQRVIEQGAPIDLWHQDGSHPSLEGSYLAACVFYATVFRESPEGLGYVAGLDEKVGGQLQFIAAETVLGDLERWYIK